MALIARIVLKFIIWLEHRVQVSPGTVESVMGERAQNRLEAALRYFSWKKFFNFWRIEWALGHGKTQVAGLPYEWEIDTTNICQLKCPLCHTGLGNIKRDKGVMHFDTFTNVVDQIKGHCIWLTLYSWGEPFLNKEIDRFIAYAHQARIATIISTNLNKPLTPAMAESLVKSGLDAMIVSLDGVTQEVYEQYRVGGRIDRVISNVKLVTETKRRLGSKTPFVEWQFIVMRQNEHQIPAAREMAKELGVNTITFKDVDFPMGANDPQTAERWLPESRAHLRAQAFDRPFNEGAGRCWRLWRSGVVNWDGGYAPCCYLTDKEQDFGDVTTHPVAEIWNNKRYVTARSLFRQDFEPEENVGCLTCSVYLESAAGRLRSATPVKALTDGAAKPELVLPMLERHEQKKELTK